MDPLEIIISAIDDASEVIAGVGTSTENMADNVKGAVDSTSASFNSFIQKYSDAEQAVALYSGEMKLSIDQVMNDAEEFGIGVQQAADEIVAANQKISTSSELMAEEVDTSMASSKSDFLAVGIAAGIAYQGISSFVSQGIANAEQWDQSSAQISNNLSKIGSSIPLSAMQAYALQIQQNTLFTQNDAIQAEAQISSYKALAPQYQSITTLAADLTTKAQAAGISNASLANTTKLLSDALADPVNGLSRLVNQLGTALPAATVTYLNNVAKAGDTAASSAAIMKNLTDAVGGSATAAANAAGGPLIQLGNQLTALGQDMVNSGLLQDLDSLAKSLIPIIQGIETWTTAHPKLTEVLLISATVFTGLLSSLALIAIVVAAAGAAVIGAVAGMAAVIAIVVALIVSNWTDFKDKTELIFNAISTVVHDIFSAMVNDMKSQINTIITIVDAFISAINTIHIDIPSVKIPGTNIGTPAVDIGFDIPQIPHLATGGIVTVPTVALIGEAGPEAIVPLNSSNQGNYGGVGGQPVINIYIQGGNYLDRQGADQIASALALKIQRQIKLRSI